MEPMLGLGHSPSPLPQEKWADLLKIPQYNKIVSLCDDIVLLPSCRLGSSCHHLCKPTNLHSIFSTNEFTSVVATWKYPLLYNLCRHDKWLIIFFKTDYHQAS